MYINVATVKPGGVNWSLKLAIDGERFRHVSADEDVTNATPSYTVIARKGPSTADSCTDGCNLVVALSL